MLFQVSAADPATFAAAAVFLGLVAAIASYLPAVRATRLDPMKSASLPVSCRCIWRRTRQRKLVTPGGD